jgi:hypothetical protein
MYLFLWLASTGESTYYGRMGKFSRFALVGGLVHQAITVPTHSLYVHARFSTISYAFPAHRARLCSVDA